MEINILMTTDELNWQEEFSKAGATQVRENLSNGAIYNSQPKRIFALHWLRQQERAAELREQEIHSYTRRTYWTAVAAVILTIFGLMATLMH